ncbi:cystathionine beta-synthase [Parafrankia colletiae]|uniref:Cystathionine beta-synthase n=1 Tax=Parafrankia colletiae TaxID=573497 RepID=A0A1S1RI07_9ACTN|nr:cystathionine beta-synthase [Parafrankia colletiae]MCK9901735.1 cystathionine beta-synthase [Frankia sp. Cpl3]OHV45860.1 cystathionine beta-synthase [Parafrankia colletiae]
MNVYDHVTDLVGDTPLVRLTPTIADTRTPVLGKLEYLNPGGSVKDRIALSMIAAAEADGRLGPGGTIVEPTSGNTGVGLAMMAARRGYRCVFTMPDKISEEKRAVLRAYGAEVIICPTAVAPDDPRSYYSVARRVQRETPGAWSPDQYSNPDNPAAHQATTGPEIWRATDGRVTHFVAGIGTGGTISGTGRYLKDVSGGAVQVVGADPEGSVYSGGSGRPYLVEGVGEDIWPSTYDKSVVDRVEAVSDRDSFLMTREIARRAGILVGGSCGLAVVAALRVARELDAAGTADGCVVVLLPDSGRGYLSKIFNDEWMYDNGFLEPPSDEPTVASVLAHKTSQTAGPPDLVHVHPDETVGAAISYLREFGVSQMPVVRHEPPVRAAEVAGAVAERDLLDAVFADRTTVDAPVVDHMSAPLPTIGAGEPLSVLVTALGENPAVLVLDEGNPTGILTRADLLTFLAVH